MSRFLRASFSAVLLASAIAAHAETELVDDEMLRLDRIQVTATRAQENASDIPAAVTIIDIDDILRQNAQTVANLAQGEIGTFVQQTGPGQGNILIRGLKGSEILHLVDGFRLNNAFFRNAPNQFMALVDPLNIERIEIVRGPMSTLYGSDAMGGVVQFLTPEPRFDGEQWQNEVTLRTRHASADDSSHSRAAWQGGRHGLGLSAGISYQDVNDLRVGGGDTLPFTSYTQRSGDVKLVFAPADGHELTVSAQYSKQPSTQRPDTLIAGFGQTNPDNAEFFYSPQERRFAQIRYRYTNPTPVSDSIDLHLGYQKFVDDRTSREFGTPNREIEQNSSTLHGLTGVAAKQLGARHQITYGIEIYQDTVDSFRERFNINSGVTSARPSRYPDGSTMDSVAVFVADDWRVSERVDLLGGLRYSRFDISLPAVINGIGVDLEPDDLTGQLGFAYALTDGLRLIGNAGRGFRAPNVFDLGTFGDRPSNRFNIPNPELKPETVTSVDLGLKFSAGDVDAEAIAYRADYRDKITSVLTGEQTETGRSIVQSRNATRLVLWGFESGLSWRVSDRLGVRASLTYTRGEEDFDGDDYAADRIPPLFGRIGLTWALAAAWDLEAWTLYSTRQDRLSPRDEIDARINPDGSAGWATVNGRVAWQAGDDLRMQLILENATDKRYREHGSGIDHAGRNVSLGLDWRF
ncbi:MAG: TonB-dependent receptor [Dokdonella sp.]